MSNAQTAAGSMPDPGTTPDTRPHLMVLYWGRRGISQLVLDFAETARGHPKADITVSVSRQNELYPRFAEAGVSLFPINMFATNLGAAFKAWRIPLIRRALYQEIRRRRTRAVIELMPHVWSSAIAPVYRKAGARYITTIHDASAHPGDPTASMNRLIERCVASADRVITLSRSVADQLTASGRVAPDRMSTLFVPNYSGAPHKPHTVPEPGAPYRFLFLGRIMPYKGLDVFVETMERLRGSGYPVAVGVYGEGALGSSAERLSTMGAEVVNRWLSEEEIADALARYDAVVLSHVEASQSGVAAMASAAGVPVIATPVGGLRDQVQDGITGVLAERADAAALAAAAQRLLDDRVFHQLLLRRLDETEQARSMATFVDGIIATALGDEA